MADEFRQALKEKAKKLRRWTTRRYLEEDFYHVEPWYDAEDMEDIKTHQVLTLKRYREGAAKDDGMDQNNDYYVPYKGEVWNQVYSDFGYVEEKVLEFGQSDPSALKDLLVAVKPISNYLRARNAWKTDRKFSKKTHPFESDESLDEEFGTDSTREKRAEILLESAMQELDQFTGATADAYVKAFGANGEWWEEVLENDYLLSEVLVRALEALLAINITQRESLMNVCDATIEKLWTLRDSSSAVKASTILTIVGAIVSTTLTVATGGSALPLVGAGFTITSAMVAAAESSGDVKSKNKGSEFAIEGNDVIGVLESFFWKVEKISGKAIEQDEELAAKLRETYDYVVENTKSKSGFEIILKDGTPKNDFGSRETSHNEDSLERAGTECFPGSAHRVLTVHDILGSTGVDVNSGVFKAETGYTVSMSVRWLAVRDLLQDLMGANGQKIRRAGDFLLDYMVETGQIDQESADDIRKANDFDTDIEMSGRKHEPWDY